MRSTPEAPVVLDGALIDTAADGTSRWIEDGRLTIGVDGCIAEAGPRPPGSRATVDLDAELVLAPGFVDAHVHLPQYDVRGEGDLPLLEWLDTLIFPAEAAFADPATAADATRRFDQALLALGTTTAAIYATVHTEPAAGALATLEVSGWLGKVLMDRGAPAALLEPADAALSALQVLMERYPGRAAAVPRFALSASETLMRGAAALAARHRAPIMTHLSESPAEVQQVLERFPDATSYTDVYARCGLLTERTLLAHAIHLGDDEYDTIAGAGCTIIHCPTANVALGSGRMPLEKLRRWPIPWALGTDVGAGPSLSMWHVIDTAIALHAGPSPLSAGEAFYRATRAGARALGLEAWVGSLTPGSWADVVAWRRPPGADGAEATLRQLAAAAAGGGEPPAAATWLRGRQVVSNP